MRFATAGAGHPSRLTCNRTSDKRGDDARERNRWEGLRPGAAAHARDADPAHQQAGYSYLLHRRHEDDYRPEETRPRTGSAGILICGEHTGTHIDALCHQADSLVLCGGIPASEVQGPRGFAKHGVEEIPPIVAPGVLLDVAAEESVGSLEPGRVVSAGISRNAASARA